MTKYKIFKYDSHNTGFYVAQDKTLTDACDIAKRLSKTHYPRTRVESQENNAFRDYEKGEMTAWNF